VGSFLVKAYVYPILLTTNAPQNVHEGPIGIGTRVQYSEVSLSVGNVISDGEAYSTRHDIAFY